MRPISRAGVAWQYINSDSFSGKDVAALQRWPRYPVSAEEKIKQINHNPAKSLSSFEFSRLIRRTSSPGTTALFTSRKRKIQRLIQKRAGRRYLMASDPTRLHFGAVSDGKSLLSPRTGRWNEMTPPPPPRRSLSEALLYGHVGEETRELLDDSHVYLWAEGDVQEEELRTGLEELLQGGRTHQTGACQHKTQRVTEEVWTKHGHKHPKVILCSLTGSLPRMSRCCSEGQQVASASMSESQTVRLAVRKSLRRRGRLRARFWKHPVLLWSVGHQPRSSSSSILMRADKFTSVLLWLFTGKRLKSTVKRDDAAKAPPAAVDKLHQTSIGQVSAAPQVHRAERAGAGGQHAGNDIVVLNLQERSSIFYNNFRVLVDRRQHFWSNVWNAEVINIWCPACKCTWLYMKDISPTPPTENRALPDHLCWKRNETVFQEQICVGEAVIVLWCPVMLSIFHSFIPRWKAKKCNFTACAGSLSIGMTQHFRGGRRWIIKLLALWNPSSKKAELLCKMIITETNDFQTFWTNM